MLATRGVPGRPRPRGSPVERFDRWARTYDRGLRHRWFFRPVHRRLLEIADPRRGERALDVGAGTGTMVASLRAAGADAFGADPSPGMIAVASGKSPGRFVVAAAEALPFGGGRFDLVISSLSIHHWSSVRAGLGEMARVLAPGGRLVVADLERPRLLRRLATAVAHRGTHAHHPPREQIAAALREAGLAGVRQARVRRGVLVTLARAPAGGAR